MALSGISIRRKLRIIGKLEEPKNLNDFNYSGYLAKDGIYSLMKFPKIELIEKNQDNFIYTKIIEFKNRLKWVIEQSLSPDKSLILGAMMLREKNTFPRI